MVYGSEGVVSYRLGFPLVSSGLSPGARRRPVVLTKPVFEVFVERAREGLRLGLRQLNESASYLVPLLIRVLYFVSPGYSLSVLRNTVGVAVLF